MRWFDMHSALAKLLATIFALTALAPGSLPAQRLTSHPAADYHPKWSPNGQTILFTSHRGGGTGIWMVPIEGGAPLPVPTGLEGDHHISWSPDMTEIVFDANEADGPPNIWILTVETGGIRRVLPPTDRGPNFHPTWSPDGSRIAFTSYRTGNAAIWVVSLGDGPLRQVTESTGSHQHPWWAPDGRTIAFDSHSSGDSDIWLVDVEAGTLVQVTKNPEQEVQPCISPDGQVIVFTRDSPAGERIWIKALASGQEARVPTGPGCAWPTWSPDGQRLACATRMEGSSDILLVDVADLVAGLIR